MWSVIVPDGNPPPPKGQPSRKRLEKRDAPTNPKRTPSPSPGEGRGGVGFEYDAEGGDKAGRQRPKG